MGYASRRQPLLPARIGVLEGSWRSLPVDNNTSDFQMFWSSGGIRNSEQGSFRVGGWRLEVVGG